MCVASPRMTSPIELNSAIQSFLFTTTPRTTQNRGEREITMDKKQVVNVVCGKINNNFAVELGRVAYRILRINA